MDSIREVEAMLPPTVNATRCLRVHSAVGSDVQHVDETLTLVAGLSPEERGCIARACYEAALLLYREEKPSRRGDPDGTVGEAPRPSPPGAQRLTLMPRPPYSPRRSRSM
jgi:hypothetical protein